MGQSLTIQTWPSRSRIVALISPTFSVKSICQFCAPLNIFSRASFTHSGQSESVWRGHPSSGLVFCHDFRRGLSDQRGIKVGPGLYLLKNWMVLKSNPAVEEIA